jgi:choice-of-anchor A domain-containing protein/uncharacterized repeat protein (TIGR01451 family)
MFFKRIFTVLLFSFLFFGNTSFAGSNLLFTGSSTDSCDLTGFSTYTQGGWSSPSNSTPGMLRDQYFDTVFPSDLIMGSTHTLTLTTANAVMNFLPQGGTSYKLITDYVDPLSTSAGVLAGQLTAAMLNVHFNAEGYLGNNPDYLLGELVITAGPFQGKTVNQLLAIANSAIGGESSGYTYSEISNALTAVNENFNEGNNNGYLDCPPLPAVIGDRVWLDSNRNGIQDEGEDGISGVKVYLFNCSDILLDSTFTAANGYYNFENLEPGDYYISFVVPANHNITMQNQGGDDLVDSDADPLTGKTVCTSLIQGEHDLSWDAGLYSTYASIGNRVWYDTNKNGIQDSGEPGAANVVIRLLNCSGIMVASTTTGSDGLYLFNDLVPGNYNLQFVLPENYKFSPQNQGANDETDSDVDTLGFTICTELISDETDLSWDAGIYLENDTYTDLSLTKTVNELNPEHGDVLVFTITVTNHGPAEATNVKVIDILPSNVIYLSSTASQGTYHTSDGIWMVGTLASGGNAELEISVEVNTDTTSNNIIDLGPAKGFNLFVLYDLNQPSSDTQGKVAVGRDAYLANYSVGDMLPNSNGTVDVLVAGRDLIYISGAVYGGNVVYKNSSNLPHPAVSVIHGTVRQDSVINFDAARIYLQTLSAQLAAYTANGTTEFQWGTLTLNGTDPHLNIFNVSGTDLSQANNFEINVPAGSVVLVNISGSNLSWMGGLTVNGTEYTNVLYNFTESGQLNLHGIDVKGSILAPYTDINFQAGVQHGQMIAKSLTGAGQFNLSFFLGHIPGQGKITNIAEIYFVDQYDPDSTPNNGVETEDDYGKVVVNVGGETGGGGNWEYIGTFISGEMVLCLLKDNSSMYAGTLGGKIFRSTDNGINWTRINSAMNAVYIWSLVKNSSNELFAGTELGVFKTLNDQDWVITSLDKEIRTLKLDSSGNLFAGVWGYGIYKSSDNGATWTPKNTGLGSVAVHALVFNSANNIIAATLDYGMFISTDGGDFWTPVSINYPYIWSLGKTVSGNLFAGTYGGGLYRSTDDGSSWEKLNNLVASFIYQIVTDGDNVYVSSWTGGVFASSDNGNNWYGLGMPGARISSMMINSSSSRLYAGTEDGRLFRSSSVTGSLDPVSQLPKEFSLMQNYPNPFNPSTIVKFSIPLEGNYSIKLYNILGQEVRTLAKGSYKPGYYSLTLDGSALSTGVYFYNLSGDNVNITRKMMLIK